MHPEFQTYGFLPKSQIIISQNQKFMLSCIQFEF